ncbi:MAG: hypothetical protein NZ455_01030 [Bacteroidia bacterium]|nr:hypothetical protein [Bacteroidia bacterium]MDW8346570.1 hypothetical protein [Bacteroidia bacterium]
MRHAEGVRQHSAERSTEAIAQPVARRPCPHERSKTWARTRPKNT